METILAMLTDEFGEFTVLRCRVSVEGLVLGVLEAVDDPDDDPDFDPGLSRSMMAAADERRFSPDVERSFLRISCSSELP